jgi:hypothetical protein
VELQGSEAQLPKQWAFKISAATATKTDARLIPEITVNPKVTDDSERGQDDIDAPTHTSALPTLFGLSRVFWRTAQCGSGERMSGKETVWSSSPPELRVSRT